MLTIWYSSLYNISVSLCLLTYGGLEKYWQLWKKASLKNLLKTKWGQNKPYNYVVKKCFIWRNVLQAVDLLL